LRIAGYFRPDEARVPETFTVIAGIAASTY
jgi:hypothetical protein